MGISRMDKGDQAERLRKLAAAVRARKMGAAGQAERITDAIVPTRVVAVTSGKGGVGKTSVTINLGLALAQRKQRVAILDADLGLANVDIAMGLLPRFNLMHVISGEKTLEEIIVEGPLGVSVIASGSGVRELANMSDNDRTRLLGSLSGLKNRFDFLLIDTAAGLNRNVLGFVLAADEIIVVTTPEPTALLDAYSMVKVVFAENPAALIKLVVNMVRDEAEAREVADKMAILVHRFLGGAVEPAAWVPRDPAVGDAVREQTPLLMLYPNSAATRCIQALAGKLAAGRERGAKSDLGGFFSRVMDFLRRKQ